MLLRSYRPQTNTQAARKTVIPLVGREEEEEHERPAGEVN